MDNVKDFGLYPKSGKKPLKVCREGRDPARFVCCKPPWAEVREGVMRNRQRKATWRVAVVVRERNDGGLNQSVAVRLK